MNNPHDDMKKAMKDRLIDNVLSETLAGNVPDGLAGRIVERMENAAKAPGSAGHSREGGNPDDGRNAAHDLGRGAGDAHIKTGLTSSPAPLSIAAAHSERQRKLGIWAAAACFVVGMGLMIFSSPTLQRLTTGASGETADGGSSGGKAGTHVIGGMAALSPGALTVDAEPAFVVVKSVEELDALPADTRAIAIDDYGASEQPDIERLFQDQDLAGLLRFTSLERLDLTRMDNGGQGQYEGWELPLEERARRLLGKRCSRFADEDTLTDAAMPHVGAIVSLRELRLNGRSKITDEGMASLTALCNLKKLSLNSCKVTDTGVARIAAGILSLESLDLGGTPVTETGLARVELLPNLVELNLSNTKVDDAGLAHVANIFTLRKLDVSLIGPATDMDDVLDGGVTDDGITHLQRLTNLEHIDLSGYSPPVEPICRLGEPPLHMRARRHNITNEGLRRLSLIPTLKTVRLVNNLYISDEGVKSLAALTRLQSLDLTDCSGVKRGGMEYFTNLLPNCRITAPDGRVFAADKPEVPSVELPKVEGDNNGDPGDFPPPMPEPEERPEVELPKEEGSDNADPVNPTATGTDHVNPALQWLADHQNPAGYWSSKNFKDDSIRIPKGAVSTGIVDFKVGENDGGWDSVDAGVTGLALMAFIGDGHTHREGRFRDTVKRGLKWMLAAQDADGLFGKKEGEEYVYNHATCTIAIAEIYAISGDLLLKEPAQRAVDWVVNAQNPGLGWRYDVKPGENDSSVTAWMVLALKSAKMAELTFPENVFAGANNWYDKVTRKEYTSEGYVIQTGYNHPDVGCARLKVAQDYYDTPSMDACCLMVRLFTHHNKPSDKDMAVQARQLLSLTSKPAWNSDDPKSQYRLDFYYWYYASLALFQMGNEYWEPWKKALVIPTLNKHQRGWHPKDIARFGSDITKVSDGDDAGRWKLDEHGSWDPVDAWGTAGGRVYATAINTLTLEVYYRYLKVNK